MDDDQKQRNGDEDHSKIGGNRAVIKTERNQSAEPLARCAQQIGGEHCDEGKVKIPVQDKMDQENERQMDEQRVTPVDHCLSEKQIKKKLCAAKT